MEVKSAPEETHKKGRQRKKQLHNSILKQMEFYFSEANLSKDRFLSKLLQESEFVDLEVFLKFNKINKLTQSTEDIAKALKSSELLEVSEDKKQLKRKIALQIKTNVDECTIYVEHIQSDTTHDWLKGIFTEFGNVVYVSIPKYHHNKLNKGFAFVEFQKEEEAKSAVDYFESIGCRISSQLEPGELSSIATFENDGKGEVENEKKRKIDECDDEEADSNENKKQKTEDEKPIEVDVEDKKKKKKVSRKKTQMKELGLQVLPKKEWKKLRNRYLDMQRSKMKMLKQHLHKKRFAYKIEDKPEQEEKIEDTNGKNKLDFIPGVIVKLKFPEACVDVKKIKNDIKNVCPDIQYVDIPTTLNSDEAFIRFANEESAKTFCEANTNGTCATLEGDDEKAYWEKIQSSRNLKVNKDKKKQRGRDRLLKKSEKALGKHIKFDD